jgi:hypothetical protein
MIVSGTLRVPLKTVRVNQKLQGDLGAYFVLSRSATIFGATVRHRFPKRPA